MIIQVKSAGYLSGNNAVISINDFPVEVKGVDNANDRGLHIVIINPSNGDVEQAKVFDTYKDSDAFNKWIITVDIPDGHIVLAASKDDCFESLSMVAMKWFSNMGSKAVWDLKYRSSYAFIGIMGHKKVNEKISNDQEVSVTQVFKIEKSEENDVTVDGNDDKDHRMIRDRSN